MQAAPYTLAFLAHQHKYLRIGNQHVLSGNGGAPLSSGNYGFLLVQQLSDGNVAVTRSIKRLDRRLIPGKVTPTGQPAP